MLIQYLLHYMNYNAKMGGGGENISISFIIFNKILSLRVRSI